MADSRSTHPKTPGSPAHDTMPGNQPVTLYDRVHATALAAVRGRRRRRRARLATTALLLVGTITFSVLHRGTPPRSVVEPGPSEVATEPKPRAFQVTNIRGLAKRLAIGGLPLTLVQRIRARSHTALPLDDQSLGHWLRAAGHAPSRIRIGERVFVPGLSDPPTEE